MISPTADYDHNKSMFGGGHLGCKKQLLEPHGGYFLALSAARRQKMSLVRTQNLLFSLPKHHLQTCSKVIGLAKEKVFDISKSISEIAYDLGFKYPRHFTRFFKQQVGLSPNEYRLLNI